MNVKNIEDSNTVGFQTTSHKRLGLGLQSVAHSNGKNISETVVKSLILLSTKRSIKLNSLFKPWRRES